MPPRQLRYRRLRPAAIVAVVLLAVGACTATPADPRPTTVSAPARSVAPTTVDRSSTTGPATVATGRAASPALPDRPTAPTTDRSTTASESTSGPTTRSAQGSTTSAGGTCVAGFCYRPGTIHQLPDGVAPESSGIAASATMPGAFFVIDDATNTAEIVAVHSDGSLVARIGISGMSARNAEAVSAGPCGSRAGRCLYVGDIGDNSARRTSISVYRVDEPALAAPPQAPLPADRWRYTYPDGPHNAEAMVVTADGSLLILTKSAPDATSGQVAPHRIYRAPAGGGLLTFVSTYRPPDPAVALQSLFTGTVVTDASYTAGRMLLLTYDEVVEYRAPRPGADPATFPSWPHAALPAPAMIQSEGITADLTGCGYEVTSEEGPNGSRAGLAGVACS